MSGSSLPEKRKDPRRGLALRVVLRDHRPPIHATTRNFSLGGMFLMTARKGIRSDRRLTAEVEIDRRGQQWTPPLPVRVVWSDHTNAGVAFETLAADAVDTLRGLLGEANKRR